MLLQHNKWKTIVTAGNMLGVLPVWGIFPPSKVKGTDSSLIKPCMSFHCISGTVPHPCWLILYYHFWEALQTLENHVTARKDSQKKKKTCFYNQKQPVGFEIGFKSPRICLKRFSHDNSKGCLRFAFVAIRLLRASLLSVEESLFIHLVGSQFLFTLCYIPCI